MQWTGDWEIDPGEGTACRCLFYKGEPWVVIAGGHEWPSGPPTNALKAIEVLIASHGPAGYKIPAREDYPENGEIEVTWLEERRENVPVPVPFWTANFNEWEMDEEEEWKKGRPPV